MRPLVRLSTIPEVKAVQMGGKGNKRVQVALRPPVLSLTEDYAKQQGISNSAAISRLVEEGLTRRGMLEAPSGFAEVPMASKSPDADQLSSPILMRSSVIKVSYLCFEEI